MAISEKWAPVFENEELLAKVLPMKPEDAQKVLEENGFNFTLDEIIETGKELYALKESITGENENSDELEEDELENIAGGAVNWKIAIHQLPDVARILSRW